MNTLSISCFIILFFLIHWKLRRLHSKKKKNKIPITPTHTPTQKKNKQDTLQQQQQQIQTSQAQQVVVQQSSQQQSAGQHTLTREVMIGNQPVHVQVLQGNTAQVIKYEINIPQESGQSIEWGHEAVLRIKKPDGTEEVKKVMIIK